MSGSNRLKKAEALIKERVRLETYACEIENRLFKIENEYLEFTQGTSLFKNLESYIHTKPEKKKTIIEEEDRVFASTFPRQGNFE